MKDISFFLFLFLTVCQSEGQLTFQKIFSAPGNQNAIAAMQSVSNDYYILSETDSGQNNSKDFLLIKMDTSGNVVWSKYFGTAADDIPTDIKEMSNGKIMLCGYTFLNGPANVDILLINIDTSGYFNWSKTYGGAQNDYAYKIATAFDSSVVVAGQTSSFGVIVSSGYVVKVNHAGALSWSVATSGTGVASTFFNSIDNTFDGGFIVTGGYFVSASAYYYIPSVKIDAFGSVVAANGYPLTGISAIGFDIKSVPGGDFIIAGKDFSGTDSGSVILMRVNPTALSVAYQKAFHTSNYEAASSIVLTPDGNFAFVGSLFNSGIRQGFLSKVNLAGALLFNKKYQVPSNFSSLNSIIVTNDNSLLMAGKVISSLDSATDIYIIKTGLTAGDTTCFEQTFSFSTNSLFTPITVGTTNNFGGISNTVTITMNSANVLQNEICNGTVDVQEANFPDSQISIYPNPSSNKLIITLPSASAQKATLVISDAMGKEALSQDVTFLNNETEIDIHSLPAGIYYLKTFNSKIFASGRFIKE